MFFEEFEEREQWIIFFISIVIGLLITISGILSGICSGNWLFGIVIGLTGFVIGLSISSLGYITALIHRKISILANNIDLQIRKSSEEKKKVAKAIEDIIVLAKQDEMTKKVRKSLNGVVQILTLKGIEEKTSRTNVLNALMLKKWKKVISTSVYGLPAEWMDPYWFSYLTLQISRAAELKHCDIIAKRYFIYKKKVVDDYQDELKLIIDAHSEYMKTYLYYNENIENKLNDSDLKLLDFILIEYDSNDRLFLWRNPGKQGEVEETSDPSKILSIEKIVNILETNEKSLDRKGILNS